MGLDMFGLSNGIHGIRQNDEKGGLVQRNGIRERKIFKGKFEGINSKIFQKVFRNIYGPRHIFEKKNVIVKKNCIYIKSICMYVRMYVYQM